MWKRVISLTGSTIAVLADRSDSNVSHIDVDPFIEPLVYHNPDINQELNPQNILEQPIELFEDSNLNEIHPAGDVEPLETYIDLTTETVNAFPSSHDRNLQFGGLTGRGMGLVGQVLPSNRFYVDRSSALSAYYYARGNYGEFRPMGGASYGSINTGPAAFGRIGRTVPRFTSVSGEYNPSYYGGGSW